MQKTNFIIITGGPGGGKTAVLETLRKKGFGYVEESGRQIIKERKSKDLPPRPDPAAFARQMFLRDLENFNKNLERRTKLFFDRSFLDSAMLLKKYDEKYFEKIMDIIDTHRFNERVFLTPPWQEIYTIDTERDQTFEEAIETYENLLDWYKSQSYAPQIIPKDSTEKRVEFILQTLNAEDPGK